MKKALFSTLAVAGLTLAGFAGPSAATPSGSGSAAGCTTWQYRIVDKTGLYRTGNKPTGGRYAVRSGTAWRGYYVNSPAPQNWPMSPSRYSDDLSYFKWGNVYDRNKNLVAKGMFVRKAMVDYVRCW